MGLFSFGKRDCGPLPTVYSDIHCHILPGLDDGAQNLETTREMFAIAYEEGIRRILCTPHYFPGRFEAGDALRKEALRRVQEEILPAYPGMELYLGNELFYSSERVIDSLYEKRAAALGNSRYVLTEFMPNTPYRNMLKAAHVLNNNGWKPIIAHVERYVEAEALQNAEELHELCTFQVNAGSLTGLFGKETQKVAKRLLKNGLIDYVGTDAHSAGRRSPRIKECAAYVQKVMGSEAVEQLFAANPDRLFCNMKKD